MPDFINLIKYIQKKKRPSFWRRTVYLMEALKYKILSILIWCVGNEDIPVVLTFAGLRIYPVNYTYI